MDQPLFYQDAYVRTFEARVVARADDGLVLEPTAFYPGGGGQPCDTGAIRWTDGEIPVHSIERRESRIVHVTGPAPPTLPGTVTGVLDWPRRHALMRTHTALHILCGVIWQKHGALSTGCGMHPGSAHIDFELEGVTPEMLADLEQAANREVAQAREVETYTLDRAEAESIPALIKTKVNLLPKALTRVRVVDIVGLDAQADGGTHVANTREVGRIRIVKYKSKGRQNKRLYVELTPGAEAA
ncbi:MAG: alanyl-tRNA editing protein [Gemmatimonadota bacterium]|nr:alanyl-tRNA editing protein [Gemmatimonadota bacterium]